MVSFITTKFFNKNKILHSMVDKKSAKKKGFRKTKGKEAKKNKKKKQKDQWKSFHLSVIIIILIGVNLVFLASWVLQSLLANQTPTNVNPAQIQRVTPEERERLIKVEVLNGCGVSGAANVLTDYLRKRDVDVVYFGNFESWDISETLVIDRRDNDLKYAKVIGDIIGVKEKRMFPQISPERQLDVTIIIGKNYTKLKAFK